MTSWRNRPAWRIAYRALKFMTLGLLIVVLIIAAYYACHTVASRKRFGEAWARPESPAPDLIEGRWTGEWKSLGVGDHGELQCVVTRDNERNEYRAQFLADHYAIFESEKGAVLAPIKDEPGKWRLEGSVDLGVEGVHHYTGRVDGVTFFLDWSSALDHGNLTLKREPAGTSPAVAAAR